MNATDYEAVTYDGEVYCLGCASRKQLRDGYPVFADSEWDYYPTCDGCNGVIDSVSLTEFGRAQAAPYKLELTLAEVQAMQKLGDGYAHGSQLWKLLDGAPSYGERGGGRTIGLGESEAWKVNDIGGEDDYRWTCYGPALREKLQALCDSIV